MARPGLFGKIRKVVRPVFLFHAERINHVRQIVPGIGQNKRRVTYFITSVGTNGCFLGWRHVRGNLRRSDCRIAPGESDKTLVEMIEPRAQYLRGYPVQGRW